MWLPYVRKSSSREPDDLIERLLFVGVTRAMTWVYLSSTDPGSLAALGKIGEARRTGSLAVQEAGEVVGVEVGASIAKKNRTTVEGLLNLF